MLMIGGGCGLKTVKEAYANYMNHYDCFFLLEDYNNQMKQFAQELEDWGLIKDDVLIDADIFDRLPHPAWATGIASQWMELGAQLCTKDGRRMGNAVVMSVEVRDGRYFACILTDAGNELKLTETELAELFYHPEWKMNPATAPGCVHSFSKSVPEVSKIHAQNALMWFAIERIAGRQNETTQLDEIKTAVEALEANPLVWLAEHDAPLVAALVLLHNHARLYIPQYSKGQNVFESTISALAGFDVPASA